MKYRFFMIPAQNPSSATDRIECFCSQHRIIEIEKQFVASGSSSFWSVCVTWAEQEAK